MSLVLNPYRHAGEFSPLDVSDLELWLDAASPNSLYDATTGGSEVTSDGSAVARWEDLSGNGRHATQGTGADQPIRKNNTLNNLPVVRFDGLSDWMATASFVHSSDFHLFAVWLSRSSGQQYNRVVEHGPNSGAAIALQSQSYFRFQIAGSTFFNSTALSLTTSAHIAELSCDGNFPSATATGKANGGSTNTQQFSRAPSSPAVFHLGSFNGNGYYGNGDLAEVVYYSSELSSTDANAVRDYLNVKWSVY